MRSHISSGSFSGFTGDCITKMDSDALSEIDSSQLAHMTPESILELAQKKVKSLNPLTCYGFTPDQVSFFNNMPDKLACKGITRDCLSHMKTTAFNGFNSGCTSLFDSKILNVINSVQLSQFTPVAIGGFTYKMIKHIPDGSCSGFTKDQLYALNSENNACRWVEIRITDLGALDNNGCEM